MCFFDADEMRRFLFGLEMGLNLRKGEAIQVFQGLIITIEGDTGFQWNSWRQNMLRRYHSELKLCGLFEVECHGEDNDGNAHAAPSLPVPRFATCSYSSCDRPSVRGRSCAQCEKHLCAVHIASIHHQCPSSSQLDDDACETGINNKVNRLLDLINISELELVASSLRDGIACSFNPGKHIGSGSMMGCANYHASLEFANGVNWLVRIRGRQNSATFREIWLTTLSKANLRP
jgi:hypothetical protein